jgi:ribosomal protein L12E/L44/L45/RPP1/RPP2
MSNPQLVDYVKEQMKAGVSEEGVRNTLHAAGWSDADVDDAIKSGKAPVAAAAGPAQAGGAMKPAMVEDVRAAITHETATEAAPEVMEVVSTSAPAKKLPLLTIVFGVTTVIFLGAAIYLYMSASGSQLSAQVSDLSAQNSSLQAQIAGLTKKNTDLTNQVAALTASSTVWASEIASLTASGTLWMNELSLFAALPELGVSPTPISLTGVVGGGGKNAYTVAAPDGVKILVQNSKDVKVDAALKPFIGSSTQVMGIHLPGSNSVTVTSVAGASVQ